MTKTILLACCLLVQTVYAQSWFTTGQNADLMISGVDFNNTGGPLYFNHPNGLATDGTHFLLCDRFNNRILVWNTLPLSWDAQPDFVLGQPDFISNNPGNGKHQLNWVGNVSVGANGKVAAADTENDRILLWNSFPQSNGQAADLSLYLPAFTPPGNGVMYGWPWGVWTDGARLAAVATGGGALLFWNSFPTADNTPPDYTIKLPQFGTPRNISTDGSSYFFVGDHNAKVNNGPGTFFWNSYPSVTDQPYDFYRDEWIKGEKLPDGKMVAGGLQSIYIWNQAPTSATQNPDITLKPDMYKNGDGVDVCYAGGRLFVNNYNGNNVLVFNDIPSNNNELPDYAVGSPSITAQTLDSIYYVQNPVPLTDGTRLIVPSDFDRAVYIWDELPTYSGQPYDHRIAMPPNVQIWASTLHHNVFITGGRNTLSVWNDAGQISQTPSMLFVNSIGTAQLNEISGVALDDQYFYLATKSGKLYVWEGIPANSSQNPILTLSSSGNGRFGFLYSDGEYLCAAQPEPPTGVDIYRVQDLAAGITTPYKTIGSGQVHLNQVSHAVTFGGSLALASRGDHSVVLWKEPADWGSSQKAVVLGQPGLNGFEAAIGLNRLFMPSALLPHENELWVGEFKFSSRILKFSYGATATSAPNTLLASARVFPNPAADYLHIEVLTPASGHYRIDLLDAQGRLLNQVFDGNAMEEEKILETLELSALNLPAGVYFLKITGPGARAVLKFIH